MGPPYGKFPILFPYLWGFLWEWYGNSMGPAYYKGVPLLGVPENPIDTGFVDLEVTMQFMILVLAVNSCEQ